MHAAAVAAAAAEDKIFQALADPSRRAIFESLTRGEAKSDKGSFPMMHPTRGDASVAQARVDPPSPPTSPATADAAVTARKRQARIAWQRRLLQAAGVILLVRLGQLQLLEGRALFEMAEDNRTQIQFIAAPRGRILDRNGVELVTSHPVFNLLYDPELPADQLDVKALAEIADLLQREGLNFGMVFEETPTELRIVHPGTPPMAPSGGSTEG